MAPPRDAQKAHGKPWATELSRLLPGGVTCRAAARHAASSCLLRAFAPSREAKKAHGKPWATELQNFRAFCPAA